MSAKTSKRQSPLAKENRQLTALAARSLKRMGAAADSSKVLSAGAVAHLFGDLEGLAAPPPMGRWRSVLARVMKRLL